MTGISPLASSVSEKHFQTQVLQLANLTGWRCYHVFDSRRSQAGFPDLVMVRAPVIVFAELKTEAGKVRPEQTAWLDALGGCERVGARLWRPSDWPEIEEILCNQRVKRAKGGR